MTAANTPATRIIVPAAQLQEHLARLLTEAPHTLLELIGLTGYSTTPIRKRLYALKKEGRVRHEPATMTCVPYVWHATAPVYVPPGQVDHDVRRRTVRVYPPINRRDTLVAALFGPAKPTGKLVGAGSVLGGEG